MANINLLILFGIGVLLIVTSWIWYWLYHRLQDDEAEICDSVRNITKPYNENRFNKCEAMKDYIKEVDKRLN